MNVANPQIYFRLGSHSEKTYFNRLYQFFNGIIVGANLFEATPGATSSFLLKTAGLAEPIVPYIIDPMTYAFGTYTDHGGIYRNDLDWIKSQPTRKGKEKRDFKKTYLKLAEKLGSPFQDAISRRAALTYEDFENDDLKQKACENVSSYQIKRTRSEFLQDDTYKEYVERVPLPKALIAPYFYIGQENSKQILKLNLDFARLTAELGLNKPIQAILCADQSFLGDAEFIETVTKEFPRTGVSGIWLWFSKLDETKADIKTLVALKSIISELGNNMEVNNLHGGYFSLILSKFGLACISHGVGYGEQKDVIPIIGKSTPTVRYYLPELHKRLGVPQIERCFQVLGIRTVQDFYDSVCDCVVCKGIVNKDVSKDFANFGDRHYSTPDSKRLAQTPAAAKRCRFHFMINRIRERDFTQKQEVDTILEQLEKAKKTWGIQPTLESESTYLDIWQDAIIAK